MHLKWNISSEFKSVSQSVFIDWPSADAAWAGLGVQNCGGQISLVAGLGWGRRGEPPAIFASQNWEASLRAAGVIPLPPPASPAVTYRHCNNMLDLNGIGMENSFEVLFRFLSVKEGTLRLG